MSKKKAKTDELMKKLNSPEAKAKAEEWRKKEEARIAALPPIEQLAEKVGSQLMWAGFGLRLHEKDLKIPRNWQKGHGLSNHPLWGYWAEKDKDGSYTRRAYVDIVSKLAFDLPEMLVKRGDEETLKRLNKSLPQDWVRIEERGKLKPDIGEPIEFVSSKYTCCGICGEPYRASFDGKEFTILNECKYPNGMFIEVDIPVPSGKLVVENDSRELFPEADKDRYINVWMESALVSIDYGEVGCAHMFVGNSCPTVYQHGQDKLAIGTPAALKGKTDDSRKTLTVDGRRYRRVAWVCTDLWWYSITDYDEWTRRAGKTPEESRGNGWTGEPHVITVKPGIYRFKHLKSTYESHVAYDTYDGSQDVYTTVRRVGDIGAEPVHRIYPA